MRANPPITVLMTVYNGGRFLSEAIQSVLSQGFRNYEFLIVDDASGDGSVAILKEFAGKDERIRLILNERNKGQTACLNQGLREAKGEWIARQDADDLSLPGRLESQWEISRKTPGLMIAGVNGWMIDEQGACTGMIHAPLSDDGIRWSLPFRNPFIHTGVMFRRQWPDGSPVEYDEAFRICQDWELWGRILERGKGINLPQRLVAYRHQEASLSHANREQVDQETRAITAMLFGKFFPSHSPNQELLSSFREGLDARHRRDFWSLYEGLRREWQGKRKKRGTCQAAAVHHFQAAGALGRKAPFAMIAEILTAFGSDPLWTIRTLCDGVFCSKEIKAGQ